MVPRSAPPPRKIVGQPNRNKFSRNKAIFKSNKRGNRSPDKFAPSPVNNRFVSQVRRALVVRNRLGPVS